MSIPRTVLRLEVTDNCELVHFDYQAQDWSEASESIKSYSQVTACQTKRVPDPDVSSVTSDPAVLLGQRKYQLITIETYMAHARPEKIPDDSFEKVPDGRSLKEVDKGNRRTDSNVSAKVRSESVDIGEVPSRTSEGATNSLFDDVDDEDHRPVSTKEHTISGALKNPLYKSHSIDYSSDSPRVTKISPRGKSPTSIGEAAFFTPVNLDLEEAKSRTIKGGHSPIPESLTFFSGNPTVETTEGIIHLYKENETTLTDREEGNCSELICMLGIPTTLTSQDIIQFVGPVAEWIEHIKIIRDATPNHYMVLIKFDSQTHTDDFYKNFNGKSFNSLESAVCHLVYVAKLETVKAGSGAGLPIPDVTELPVCPVCLERMDESINGILTILCNHSFHTACLAHWDDTSCPVCRYTQTPESVADNKCFECSADESLWICLICGYVGCGRYVQGHAFKHFQQTNHTFSMQLGSNRVWDYAGDNYVHRLVQNKSDGKMVQVGEDGQMEGEEKLDAITLEYTYLLNTQLESQRHYFESKLALVESEAVKQLGDAESHVRDEREKCHLLEERLSQEVNKRKHSDKKCDVLGDKYRSVLGELAEEKEMNRNLCENQTVLKAKVTNLEERLSVKDKEIRELQEQLRDVMIFLDAQQKLSSASGVSQQEIQDSTVVLGTSPKIQTKKSRKKGK